MSASPYGDALVTDHILRQRSLFHVLHGLSLRCETCGYCQGMGPIAATLLCYFDPERVYASLVRIHDSYSMHDVFSPGFPGLLEAIYVQERIMEQMMPDVFAAFKKHMISTTSYATKWYITLFANSVPFQTQLRLWDAFLLDGHDVFVVVAVAIVWVYRGTLLLISHIRLSADCFEQNTLRPHQRTSRVFCRCFPLSSYRRTKTPCWSG